MLLQKQQPKRAHQESRKLENITRSSPTSSWAKFKARNSSENYRQFYGNNSDENDQDDNDWRQAAQMLTEQDEMRLLGQDSLDVAPVRRTRQQQSSSGRHSLSSPISNTSRQQLARSKSPINTSKQNEHHRQQQHRLINELSSSPSLQDENQPQHYDDDDNSSISFAQSGCHSILSAWRIKAANRAARLAGSKARQGSASNDPRPMSVLSNCSSQGKRSAASTAYTLGSRAGKSPASKSRIQLGPKVAQHFVTNSKRRRRANELILSTLEARRRALALNRQQLGSLFGSDTYLAAAIGCTDSRLGSPVDGQHLLGSEDYQRLLMSPSPGGRSKTLADNHDLEGYDGATQSPIRRSALSDLGGTRSNDANNDNQTRASKWLTKLTNPIGRVRPSTGPIKQHKLISSHKKIVSPPLAKLDQNSSDLCTTNSSSNDESRSTSSEAESQFTQLVSSEIAPDCVLLDEQALRSRVGGTQKPLSGHQMLHRPLDSHQKLTSPQMRAPKAPERTRLIERQRESSMDHSFQTYKEQSTDLASPKQESVGGRKMSSSDDDEKLGTKLRRGALKRDSIRRMRLNRTTTSDSERFHHQQKAKRTTDDTSNNSSSSMSTGERVANFSGAQQLHQRQSITSRPMSPTSHDWIKTRNTRRSSEELRVSANQKQPLSKTRKLDIESNPFLNRHHFRSLSTRSMSSDGNQPRLSIDRQPQLEPRLVAAPLFKSPLTVTNNHRLDQRSGPPAAISASEQRRQTSQRNTTGAARLKSPPRVMTSQRPSSFELKETENVRQVEQMLRQMQPNQAFVSRTLESSVSSESLKQRREQDDGNRSRDSKANTNYHYEKQRLASTTNHREFQNYKNQSSRPTVASKPINTMFAQKRPESGEPKANDLTTTNSQITGQLSDRYADYNGRGDNYPRRAKNDEDTPSAQPSKLVQEGARSSDDLVFDARGNRRKLEWDERWRHEQVRPTRLPDGSIFSEQLLISERVEIMRQSSGGIISPPAEFADHHDENQQPRPTARATSNKRPNLLSTGGELNSASKRNYDRENAKPIIQLERKDHQMHHTPMTLIDDHQQQSSTSNSGHTYRASPEVASLPRIASKLQQNPTNSRPTTRDSSNNKRALSEDRRPIVPPRPTRISSNQLQAESNEQQSKPMATTRKHHQLSDDSILKSYDSLRVIQASLPKFERTADDEFRKRVDRLRQIAKANLQADEDVSMENRLANRRCQLQREQQITGSGLHNKPNKQLVRPLSTNWNSKKSAESELDKPRASRQTGPGDGPLATNLDDMLLADGYQQPLAGSWRRSNSSLASIGAHQRQQQHALTCQPRARSFVTDFDRSVPTRGGYESGGSLLSQSVMSAEPLKLGPQANPMRLLVSEKNAPRLDFAIVEQRENGSSESGGGGGGGATARQRPERAASPRPARPASVSAPSRAQAVEPARAQQVVTPLQARPPRPAQPANVAVSARSPELGAASDKRKQPPVASSSNDDSAIASSVSSPSLSFSLMNASNGNNNGELLKSLTKQHEMTTKLTTTTTTKAASLPDPLPGIRSQSMRIATGGQQARLSSAMETHVKDPPTAGLPSILRRQQQQQEQQASNPSSVGQSQQHEILANPSEAMERQQRIPTGGWPSQRKQAFSQNNDGPQQQRQNEQQQRTNYRVSDLDEPFAQAGNTKRVHFNDRTSIRSFESISSINSASIATQNELNRQQIGSPDSMGSGSTSRLSGESPDLRKGSGAAIYAIRGDPELESSSMLGEQQQQVHGNNHQREQQMMMSMVMGSRMGQPQLQLQQQHRQPIIYDPSMQQRPMAPPSNQPVQQMGPSSAFSGQQHPRPSIQMTAPPTITGTNTISASGQQQHQRALGSSAVLPLHHRQVMIAPLQAGARVQTKPMFARSPAIDRDNNEDEDPNYALRLRQAATSRVFSYVPPTSSLQQLQQQQYLQPASARVAVPTSRGQTRQQVQSPASLEYNQASSDGSRRQPMSGDLLNFQTEV